MGPGEAPRARAKLALAFTITTILLVTCACSGTTQERAGRSDTAGDAGHACIPPAGTKKGVAKGAYYAEAMTTDEQNAYWVDGALGAIMKESLGDGDPVKITTPNMNEGPMSLAVNSTDVFWVNAEGFHRAPIAGGTTEVVPFAGNTGLFVDDEYARYTANEPDGPDAGAGVHAVLDEMNLGTQAVRHVAVGRWALSLVVVGPDIFGTTCVANGVWRVSETDGTFTTLVAETFCPMEVVAADGALYFSDQDQVDGYFFRRLRCEGEKPETLATPKNFFEFAIDGASAYLLEHGTSGDDSVVRVPLGGGDPVEISKATNACNGIGVAGGSVYWLEGTSGPCGSTPSVLRSAAK